MEDFDLRWADSVKCFGGESNGLSKIVVGALFVVFAVSLKVRLETERGLVGVGIGCDSGALGSFWNRDLRCTDWRGGRGGPTRLLGLGGVRSGEIVG